MAHLTTITNISSQTVPVLIDSVSSVGSNANSDIDRRVTNQTSIAPGAQLTVENSRIDEGQLDQLRRLKLINYISR
jgi:hypothetical protein